MGINGLVLLRISRRNGFLSRVVAFSVFTASNLGCADTNTPGEYRESQGKVTKFTVELTDRALTIATPFIKLQDGSVIQPKMYYYQYHKTLIGVRQVEKGSRIFRSIGRDLDAKYRAYYLPTSEEIVTYFFLVRTSVLKEGRKRKAKFEKADYEMGDWQLLEIEAKDLSPEKPLVIPSYKRELTKEQKELLQDLVQRYDKIEAAAKKVTVHGFMTDWSPARVQNVR